MKTPLIILTFTNEDPSDPRYLRVLKTERAKLEHILEKALGNGLCEFKIYQDRSLDDLLQTLGKKEIRDRLVIFHYGGHADSLEMRLTDENYRAIPFALTRLSTFFKSCPNLQLLFLNGCYSMDQAEHFLNEGVPIVIGSERSVADRIATEFAEAFYQQLLQNSISNAFRFAMAQIRGKYDNQRREYYREDLRGQGFEKSADIPFRIDYRQNIVEQGRWNLSEAAGKPLFGLPDIPNDPQYQWPAVPYDYLKPYTAASARIFRGRDEEISQLFRDVMSPVMQHDAVITVSGQSGVGKSSLLQAGLIPRLQGVASVLYFRRQAGTTFHRQLLDAMNCSEDELKTRRLEKEEREDRPQIIIFDQVDELFSRGHSEASEREWSDLLQLIRRVTALPAPIPRGRFVLSYRTEVHQRIVEDLRTLGLNSKDHFIRRLDRAGIVEIVHGLDRKESEIIADMYQLTVDPGLGEDIASFLLRDPQSPVAPVLQIILTRLWKISSVEDGRQFTRRAFEELTQKGVWLSNFFQQQIRVIRNKETEFGLPVEGSGLVLDLLNYHTTDRSTALIRTRQEILTTYSNHNAALIQKLRQELEVLSLLATKDKSSTLAHDTLGPIVKEAFEQSTRPGQNAYRLLKSKLIEHQLHPDEAILEEPALDIVLVGKDGMRQWTDREKRLIDKSLDRLQAIREQERKERRARFIRRVAGAAGLVLIGLLAFFLWSLYGQRAYDRAFKEAEDLADQDATVALDNMEEIYTEHDLGPEYEKRLYDVYHDHLIYQDVYRDTGIGRVNQVAFHPNGAYFALATDKNQHVYLHQFGETAALFSFTEAGTSMTDLVFDEAGNLFLSSIDRKGYRWRPLGDGGVLVFDPEPGQNDAYPERIVPGYDSDRCFTLHNEGDVYVWSKSTGEWLGRLSIPEEGNAIAPFKDPQSGAEGVWVGTDAGGVYGFGTSTEPIYRLDRDARKPVSALCSSRNGRHLLIGSVDGSLEYWSWQSDEWILRRTFPVQNGEVKELLMDPQRRWVAAVYRSGQSLIWDLNQDLDTPLHQLDGQEDEIHSLGYHPAEQTLLTADEKGRIRSWAIPYPYPQEVLKVSSFNIMTLSFADDQSLLAVDKNSRVLRISLPEGIADTIAEISDFLRIPPVFNAPATQLLIPRAEQLLLVLNTKSGKQGIDIPIAGPVDLMAAGTSFGAAVRADTLWSWKLGQSLQWQKKIDLPVAVAISRDEQRLATATDQGRVSWFGLPDGDLLEVQNYEMEVRSLSPSEGGDLLLLGYDGDLLRIAPGRPTKPLEGGTLVAPARDGGLYGVLQESSVGVYVYPGYLLESFDLADEGDIQTLVLSPGGRWMAAGTNDGQVWIWRITKRPLSLEKEE